MSVLGKRTRVEALGKRDQPARGAKAQKTSSTPVVTRKKTVTPKTTRRKASGTPKKPATPKRTTTPKTKRKTNTPKKATPKRTTTPKTKRKTTTPKTKRRKSSVRTPKREVEASPVQPKRVLPQVPEEEEVYWKEWKDVFLVGTEWDNYDALYDIEWDFDHLNEDITEGFLHESPNTKYVFGTTECKYIFTS